jgi:hypothetical protein
MIKDLVLHLLRQGCYSEEGDIVVLCAYLGQLARVRDALGSEVAVIIDGRDKENLAEQEEELEDRNDLAQVERIQVTKRVCGSHFELQNEFVQYLARFVYALSIITKERRPK